MGCLFLFAALAGHAMFMAAAVNRLHGFSMPRPVIRAITRTMLAWTVAVPAVFAVWMIGAGLNPCRTADWLGVFVPVDAYLAVCWAALAVDTLSWTLRGVFTRPSPVLLRETSDRSGPLIGRAEAGHRWVRWSFNELLDLDRVERVIELPRLSPSLDGLTILHLSDLHFSGRVSKSYFDVVIARCAERPADLVAVTGDVVEKAECAAWISDTLGRLTARYGRYFVLGNHDRTAGAAPIRRAMTEAGWIDLGGRWMEVSVSGGSIVLAGNELPWFGPAPDLSAAPPAAPGGPIRVILSHSPDQLGWARRQEADLVLAGHVHGGQFRLPWVGPILSPSRWGVKYAMGTFYERPTVLHVTRGVSGKIPLRLRCAPEAVWLVLRAPEGATGDGR